MEASNPESSKDLIKIMQLIRLRVKTQHRMGEGGRSYLNFTSLLPFVSVTLSAKQVTQPLAGIREIGQ